MTQNSYIATHDDEHAIVIPIDRDTLGVFIGSLLGRPQTIENSFAGNFDLGREHIENVFHLVDQRIRQQNKGKLIQFTVTVAYSDESSILLNSLEDFISYREVRPQVSVAAELSWTYLIQFEDRPIPEKQVVELSIFTHERRPLDPFDILIFGASFRKARSSFVIRIQHTARSWGVDVEHLLMGQIKSWIREESWIKKTIYQHPGLVGFFFGAGLVALGTWSVYEVTQNLLSTLHGTIEATRALSIDQKLDRLIALAVDSPGSDARDFRAIGFFISFFVGGISGIIMSALADNPPKNYLVLSEAAKSARADSLEKRTRGWTYFILSGLTATTAGILSRYLFSLFFSG